MSEEEEAIYREVHKRKIREGKKRSGKKGGRPRKEINIRRVKTRYAQGIPLYQIATLEGCCVNVLKDRLKEAGVVLKKELKAEE